MPSAPVKPLVNGASTSNLWQKSKSTACWRARLRKISELRSRDREGAVFTTGWGA
jgi:hypothetical protein